MRAVAWVKVLSAATSQWLPYDFCTGVVSGFSSAEQPRVTVGVRYKFVSLPAVPEFPLLRSVSSWIDARN